MIIEVFGTTAVIGIKAKQIERAREREIKKKWVLRAEFFFSGIVSELKLRRTRVEGRRSVVEVGRYKRQGVPGGRDSGVQIIQTGSQCDSSSGQSGKR